MEMILIKVFIFV